MDKRKDLLIEIGTEELPPKALRHLAESFSKEIRSGLENQSLSFSAVDWYATPRRLAVIVKDLVERQQDRENLRRGPALAAAFDAEGNPSKAALGFAGSCHVAVDALERLETDNGSWLVHRSFEKGKTSVKLLPDIINTALNRLPIPKRMRWGDRDVEFVRPVHWVMVLSGEKVVACEIMDMTTGNTTYGHRFHYPKPIQIRNAKEYLKKLKKPGSVIADFQERKDLIEKMVIDTAIDLKGKAVIDPDLLDEVTSLVEWPVVIAGSYDKKFLALPREVLIASMQDHQRYFPVQKRKSTDLINHFITIANIDSRDIDEVKQGNERVIRPRLNDAEFFWQRDNSRPLNTFENQLHDVVFQKQLGTLADKTQRVKKLAGYIARTLEHSPKLAERAAVLSKCDLFTEMVGEFPGLQGIMGKYYALNSNEPADVAQALHEQYLPRFAGDALPESPTGQILSIADKIDTIVGIFGIGQAPSGDRDPFALRRAAIGIIRIIAECKLPLDLHELIAVSTEIYGTVLINAGAGPQSVTEVAVFFRERARHNLREQGFTAEEVDAVLNLYANRPSEYAGRLNAVRDFMTLPEASGLAEANKRIINIISKSDETHIATMPEVDRFEAAQERALYEATRTIAGKVNGYIENGRFSDALHATASLHGPVTDFFDHVMVNVDDDDLRRNRFALLNNIADLTNQVADISKLAT